MRGSSPIGERRQSDLRHESSQETGSRDDAQLSLGKPEPASEFGQQRQDRAIAHNQHRGDHVIRDIRVVAN